MTIHIPIPGDDDLRLEHLVLDINATLTDRGEQIPCALTPLQHRWTPIEVGSQASSVGPAGLTPRSRVTHAPARPAHPSIDDERAERLVAIAKALADPVRLRLVDVLRDHPRKVCPCGLVPRFELTQPTISHHRKLLKDAGILDSEKHGPFVSYHVTPRALAKLAA